MHVFLIISITQTFLVVIMLQFWSSPHTMPKKSEKKAAKALKVDLDVYIISRMEITYEDTKAIAGVDQEFKWGEIY